MFDTSCDMSRIPSHIRSILAETYSTYIPYLGMDKVPKVPYFILDYLARARDRVTNSLGTRHCLSLTKKERDALNFWHQFHLLHNNRGNNVQSS